MKVLCLLIAVAHAAFLRSSETSVLSTRATRAETRLRRSRDVLLQTHEAQRLAYEANRTAEVPEGSYVPTGCMKVNPESLTPQDVQAYNGSEGKLTLERCYYYCVTQKRLWMLVSKGTECICVDEFEGDDADGCSTTCEGSSETCGGSESSDTYLLTSWVPEIKVKPCGVPTPIQDSEKMCGGGGGELPSTCNITCNTGFLLKDNSMICDGSTGEWFGNAYCKEIMCGLPQPIPGALSMCMGASALKPDCAIECKPGFNLELNSLACGQAAPESSQGIFSGEAICAPITCGLPPAMEHALYNGEHEVVFPNMVDYGCMKGFTTDGTPVGTTAFVITCGEDGAFTELPSTCKPIECGMPPVVEKAMTLQTESAFFMQAVEYTCDEGHYLGGLPTGAKSTFVDCTATGEFAPAEPCEPVICGVPPELPYATFTADPTLPLTLGQAVQFTCEPGYSLDPRDKAKVEFVGTCAPEGHFAGVAQCLPVDCPAAPEEAHALVAEGHLVYLSLAVYECEPGHSIDGTVEANRSFVVNCLSDASLSSPGECLPVACPPPPQSPHRQLTTDAPHKYGNALTYTCDDGFSTDATENSGAKTVILSCQETGQWAEVLPCIEIDDCAGHSCGPYGECIDEHMDYHCECQSGFEVTIDEETNEPTCGNIDDCGDCGVGTCEDLINDFTCHCPEGYELVTEPEKTCQAVLCGDPPKIAHSDRPDQKAFYPDVIGYTCHPGTSIDGTAEGATAFSVGCNAQKAFTGEEECKLIECGPPLPIIFAAADVPSAVFNETVTYTCAEGHTTDGMAAGEKSFAVGCMATGQFAQPLACLPVDCGSPPPVVAGVVDMQPRTFEMTATYECEEGHSVDGTANADSLAFTVECGADGVYSGLQACQPVQCGAPPHFEKAFASTEEALVYPLGAEYICDEGYTLDGTLDGEVKFYLTCGAAGELVGDIEAKCQPIPCEPIEVMDASLVTTGAITFTGEAKYKCADGYAMESLLTDATHVSPEGAVSEFSLSCLASGFLTAPPACKNIDDCHGHSCGAHGTCVDLINDYTCDCQPGFEINTNEKTGEKTCGNVDDCKDAKCGEYGVCVDFTGGYTCQCMEGYVLTELDDVHKSCEAARCPQMPPFDHASHNGASEPLNLVFPESALFVCDNGYSTDGTMVPEAREFTISCLPTGDNSAPSACHPVICGVPPAVTFAHHDKDPLAALAFGAELSYKCQDGYSLDGNKAGTTELSIKCTADGLFEETLGCFPKVCGAPPPVADASVAAEVVFPGVALYECASGFSMDGSAEALTFEVPCLPSGEFASLPEALGGDAACQRVKCGEPPSVGHASFDAGERVSGESVLYVCDDGYTSSGTQAGLAEFSIACEANGQYSALPTVACALITVTVQGQVKDATNNAPVGGVTVRAMQTVGREERMVEAVAAETGIYSLTLALGAVQLKTEKAGFIEAKSDLLLSGNIPVGAGADISVSPTLPPDGWRVVLKWDQKPYDLDSHFFYGPGGRGCHMFWARTTMRCGNGIIATLDVDDTNGFGPETSTLKHVGSGCRGPSCQIKFIVHNYSRNPPLAASGAVVKLYNGDRMVREFKVGTDGEINGDKWTVFELNGELGQLGGFQGESAPPGALLDMNEGHHKHHKQHVTHA